MRIPEELQKETIEEVKDENFDKFIENFKEAISFNREKLKLIERYASKINSLQDNFDKAVEYLKNTLDTAIKGMKVILDSTLKYNVKNEVDEESLKTKASFTINSIKELDGVEDCYMEDNVLCVVTKEVEKEKYVNRGGSINLGYTMPSYIIRYFLANKKNVRYRQSLDSEYKVRIKQQELSFSIGLTDPEKYKELILEERVLLENINNVYRNNLIQSPYQSPSAALLDISYYETATDLCSGDHNQYQKDNLTSYNLIPHLIGVIQTLYTEDDDGKGYSFWGRMISQIKKVQLTLKFKEEFGNVDDLVWTLDSDQDSNYFTNKIVVGGSNIAIGDSSLLGEVRFNRVSNINDEIEVKNFAFICSGAGYIEPKLPKKLEINGKKYSEKEFINKLKKIYESVITNGNQE